MKKILLSIVASCSIMFANETSLLEINEQIINQNKLEKYEGIMVIGLPFKIVNSVGNKGIHMPDLSGSNIYVYKSLYLSKILLEFEEPEDQHYYQTTTTTSNTKIEIEANVLSLDFGADKDLNEVSGITNAKKSNTISSGLKISKYYKKFLSIPITSSRDIYLKRIANVCKNNEIITNAKIGIVYTGKNELEEEVQLLSTDENKEYVYLSTLTEAGLSNIVKTCSGFDVETITRIINKENNLYTTESVK